MLHELNVIAHYPLVLSILTGVGAAAVVDVHAFLSWQNLNQFATYDKKTMLLRWLQGAVVGLLTGFGFNVSA